MEQKNAEIAEKTKTVEGYLAQVVRASEERTRVEGQLREANNSRAAFESAKARMEQEATLLQQHNEWLRSELAKKSEELLAARKKGSHDALAAANQLEDAKRDAAALGERWARRREAASAAQTEAARSAEELRNARETAAKMEAHFDKELNTAKRLSELYKKQAEGAGIKPSSSRESCERYAIISSRSRRRRRRRLPREEREEVEKALADAKAKLERTVAAAASAGSDRWRYCDEHRREQ